jgi:nucleotide-binding universal stress UspA family protein
VTILSVAESEEEQGIAWQRIERAKKTLEDAHLPGRIEIKVGHPSEVIIEEAGDHDIVVLGASRRRGVFRFLLGSTPLKVSEYGVCPVLIVR